MSRFKMIKFVSRKKRRTVVLRAFVPGINSGVYTKALAIEVENKEFRTLMDWVLNKRSVVSITLDADQVGILRNECNKILNTPLTPR